MESFHLFNEGNRPGSLEKVLKWYEKLEEERARGRPRGGRRGRNIRAAKMKAAEKLRKLKDRNLRMKVFDLRNFFTQVPRKQLKEAVEEVLRRTRDEARRRTQEWNYY